MNFLGVEEDAGIDLHEVRVVRREHGTREVDDDARSVDEDGLAEHHGLAREEPAPVSRADVDYHGWHARRGGVEHLDLAGGTDRRLIVKVMRRDVSAQVLESGAGKRPSATSRARAVVGPSVRLFVVAATGESKAGETNGDEAAQKSE